MKPNIVREKSFSFAVDMINLYKEITTNRMEYVMSKQLMRSATSVGANIREAQSEQSKKDFIHKLSISQKEADESLYWLELLERTEYINKQEFDRYHAQKYSGY